MSGTETHSDVSVQQPVFDYGELSGAAIKQCEASVSRITKRQRSMAADVIAIGKELVCVKDRLEHGQFGPWLKHYFGWSQQTANNMMSTYTTFGLKFPDFGNLTIDTSALYLLSSEKCDDDTREELIERAQNGERITHAIVKQELNDEIEEPSYEDRIDRVVDRIRSLAKCSERSLLVARLKVLCEELSYDD